MSQEGQTDQASRIQRGAMPWILVAMLLVAVGGVAAAWSWMVYNDRVHRERIQAEKIPDGQVVVTFDSVVVDNLPVKFYAADAVQTVTVGEDVHNTYYLENLSDQTIYIRPQHSVTPDNANRNFKLSQCFCFNDQSVAPNEKKEFTVIYRFTKGLDEQTDAATMRYVIHRIQESDLRPVGTLPKSE